MGLHMVCATVRLESLQQGLSSARFPFRKPTLAGDRQGSAMQTCTLTIPVTSTESYIDKYPPGDHSGCQTSLFHCGCAERLSKHPSGPERLLACPLAPQTPDLWGLVGQSEANKAPGNPMQWAWLGGQRQEAWGQPTVSSCSQPCFAPAFPCHLHVNEGKIGHQLLWSEKEMVFEMGWEGPWVPVRHTSNSRLVQESKMLIERVQSYSPAHCCSELLAGK